MKSFIVFVALTFCALRPFAQVAFTFSSVQMVGTSPHAVVAADVNGDGWPDLICANASSASLTVLFNDGTGNFYVDSSPGVGNGPDSVIATDVNGDGFVDLVCGNFSDHTLSIMTNDGTGNFDTASTPSVSTSPYSLAVADITGNGTNDLVCGFYDIYGETDELTVLTNFGAGVYTAAFSPVVGQSPFSVATADVNGDGSVDLISANWAGDTLTVLTNNGAGAFGLSATLNVGNSPICVIAADVNADGMPDLICANSLSGSLTVYTNNGSGGFVLETNLPVGSTPYSVVAADVNGDGWPDLICANFGDETLTVLTNNTAGGFGFAATLDVGNQPAWVTAADVNQDGELDLISANYGDGTLTVLDNSTLYPAPALPNITWQPASQTVTVGTSQHFAVGAVGYPPVTGYQWQFAGTNLPGATNAVLSLNSISSGQGGLYDVVISNSFGEVTSSNALLTVGPEPPSAALATAITNYGYVVSITINFGGYGYTNTPGVYIIGGGGSGAQATAVVSNGVVVAVNIVSLGSGYTNLPAILIAPPNIPNPVIGVVPMSSLAFSNLTVGGTYQFQAAANGGWTNLAASFSATNSLYTQMVPGLGLGGLYRLARAPFSSQATATAIVDYGFIVAIPLTSGGAGYLTSPAVRFVGGGGNGAEATAEISSSGAVTNLVINDNGAGYTSPPTVQIAPPPAGPGIAPTITPIMQFTSASLLPLETYQIQFTPAITSPWQNWSNGLFSPVTTTNSQYLAITNRTGFFRLKYVP